MVRLLSGAEHLSEGGVLAIMLIPSYAGVPAPACAIHLELKPTSWNATLLVPSLMPLLPVRLLTRSATPA